MQQETHAQHHHHHHRQQQEFKIDDEKDANEQTSNRERRRKLAKESRRRRRHHITKRLDCFFVVCESERETGEKGRATLFRQHQHQIPQIRPKIKGATPFELA